MNDLPRDIIRWGGEGVTCTYTYYILGMVSRDFGTDKVSLVWAFVQSVVVVAFSPHC